VYLLIIKCEGWNLHKLRTENLVKIYGERTVVSKVCIELKKGEIVGLLGPNGAGKTTSFNMIVGLIKPNSGSIWFDDTDITNYPMYKRSRLGMGYLTQDVSIFRKLTVKQNILSILETLPLKKKERKERLNWLLEELGISHLSRNYAYTLSGGERRRVEIARSLAPRPSFMLLDEPFSGVDPKSVEELQSVIYQLRDHGLGILITDHSVRETLQVTDRSYLIYEGKVEFSGNANDLVNNPKARDVYLGQRFYMDMTPDDRKQQPPGETAKK
jgi:lipopolysaccharide export system ATP-binding protein